MLPCRNVFGVAMSSSPLGRGFEDGDVDVASPSVSGVAMSSSPSERL